MISNDFTNLNIAELDSLSEEEKKLALEILKQYAADGQSNLFEELKYTDFEEIPVDIHTFLHDKKYLGNALYDAEGRFTLFPYWEERLQDIFPDNLTTKYNNIVLTGCLAYDTEIPLLNGKVEKIGDLAKNETLDEYVYSYDVETNSYVPGHLIAAFSTGIKPIYEIELDNGTIIKATSNHRFMTRDKHWKSIDTGLAVGDSMMPSNLTPAQNYNHKIIRITYMGEEEVYDLTVEKYHNFAINNGIIAHNSIGIGKTLVADVILLYMLYRLLCLKDPYQYYGMQPIDKISIAFLNITIENAKGVALDKMNQMILSSEWFMAHGEMAGTTNLIYRPDKHIELIAASSNNQIIGRALFCLDGQTKIETAEGIFALEDLVEKQIQVVSIDKNGNRALSDFCTVKPTINTAEEYQIELEDGSILCCTGNHRLMLADGTYKEAQYLTIDDELMQN